MFFSMKLYCPLLYRRSTYPLLVRDFNSLPIWKCQRQQSHIIGASTLLFKVLRAGLWCVQICCSSRCVCICVWLCACGWVSLCVRLCLCVIDSALAKQIDEDLTLQACPHQFSGCLTFLLCQFATNRFFIRVCISANGYEGFLTWRIGFGSIDWVLLLRTV